MDSNDSVISAVPELDSHDWFTALDARHQALLRAASVVKHYEAGAVYTQADLAPAVKSTTDSVLHHIEHCPFCLNHAGSVGLPPPALSPLAAVTGHDAYPPLFYQAPQPQFAWLAASPRGPPSLA